MGWEDIGRELVDVIESTWCAQEVNNKNENREEQEYDTYEVESLDFVQEEE